MAARSSDFKLLYTKLLGEKNREYDAIKFAVDITKITKERMKYHDLE